MTILNLFSAESQGTEAFLLVPSAAVNIASNVAKTGTYSLRVNPTTTNTAFAELGGYGTSGSIKNNFSTTAVFVSFDFYISILPAAGQEPFFSLNRTGGALLVYLSVQSDGTLQATDPAASTFDGSAVLSTGVWYHLEVSWDIVTRALSVNIDGVNDISATTAAGNTLGRIRFGKVINENGQTVDFNYDNILIDDAAFHADAEVAFIVPTAAGTDTGWTNGTGPSDYTQVNNVPLNAATRITSNAVATDDDVTFNMTSMAGAGVSGTIYGVLAWSQLEEGSGDSVAKFRIRSGATIDNGGDMAVPAAAGRNYGRIYETDPDTGIAWTVAGLDAAEFGLRKPASDPDSCECEAYHVMVAYKPSAGGTPSFPTGLHKRAANTLLRM